MPRVSTWGSLGTVKPSQFKGSLASSKGPMTAQEKLAEEKPDLFLHKRDCLLAASSSTQDMLVLATARAAEP